MPPIVQQRELKYKFNFARNIPSTSFFFPQDPAKSCSHLLSAAQPHIIRHSNCQPLRPRGGYVLRPAISSSPAARCLTPRKRTPEQTTHDLGPVITALVSCSTPSIRFGAR